MLQFFPLSQHLFKNSDLLSVFEQKKMVTLVKRKILTDQSSWIFQRHQIEYLIKNSATAGVMGEDLKKKYFHWDNETIRDTQSSSKSLWIGASHQFHLESFGRNGIHMTEATGFTPEPQEEKVVYKDRWQNGPRLD